jgi:hypothetical protein
MIAYASKTLTGAQLNYATTEKELLVVVFAIDKFRSDEDITHLDAHNTPPLDIQGPITRTRA